MVGIIDTEQDKEKQEASLIADAITLELIRCELHKAYVKKIVLECLKEFFSEK